MKVWFGCTTAEWGDYRKYYFAIHDQLVDLGCVILQDWIKYADEAYEGNLSRGRSKKVYKQVTDAIAGSDVVVIENTVPNFSTATKSHLPCSDVNQH